MAGRNDHNDDSNQQKLNTTNQKVEDSQLEKWPGKNLEDLTNSTSIDK